jgi:hypothetical protein
MTHRLYSFLDEKRGLRSLKVLSRVELSLAYPHVSLAFVSVAVLSWLVLGERLSARRIIGIGLIVIGGRVDRCVIDVTLRRDALRLTSIRLQFRFGLHVCTILGGR